MALDVAAVMTALKAKLLTIPVVKEAHLSYPDNINLTPAAFVVPKSVNYDLTARRGMDIIEAVVTVVVGRTDKAQTIPTLYTLISGSDTGSVKYILELDRTLGGTCSKLRVGSAEDIGRSDVTADYGYLVADFRLTISG